MELLLNIVWLIVAAAALWRFLGSASTSRKQFLVALGALVCSLLLLFPSISVSDDLHLQAFVAEDSSPGKRLVNVGGHSALSHQFAMFVTLFSALFAALRRITWFVRNSNPVSYLSALLERPVLGRAPPVSSLA